MLNENKQNEQLQGIYDALEQIQWSIEGLSLSIIQSQQPVSSLSALLGLISSNLDSEINALHGVIIKLKKTVAK